MISKTCLIILDAELYRHGTVLSEETVMKIICRRCAGLDVHEKSVFVCARIMNGKSVEVIEATFPTFTFPNAPHTDPYGQNRCIRLLRGRGGPIPRAAREASPRAGF